MVREILQTFLRGRAAMLVREEPRPRAILELGWNGDDLEAHGAIQRIEEPDGGRVSDPTTVGHEVATLRVARMRPGPRSRPEGEGSCVAG